MPPPIKCRPRQTVLSALSHIYATGHTSLGVILLLSLELKTNTLKMWGMLKISLIGDVSAVMLLLSLPLVNAVASSVSVRYVSHAMPFPYLSATFQGYPLLRHVSSFYCVNVSLDCRIKMLYTRLVYLTQMGYLSVFRAVAVRLIFTAHGVISIWRLTIATNEPRYWYLGLALCLLLMEMTITLGKKAGKEWKWFCPSVFIYLMCIVPTIWFLKLHELDRKLGSSNSTSNDWKNETEGLRASFGTILGASINIKIPINLNSDEWIRLLEQLLLLILILGRWFLPKGKLTHDQLSQLLLVYIGTAADIVEFFEAFKEEKVIHNRLLCIIILGIWSMSLIQFSLVLTASRVRRDRSGLMPLNQQLGYDGCCNADVYGIIISILLQDLPFLMLRMLLIFKYYVLSYTNMFFTCKNTIVIVLLLYRLIVVQVERKRLAMAEDMTSDILPRYSSSPAIFDHNVRRNKGRTVDSVSLSNSNTLSTCSTKCSNRSTRIVQPFSSCSNIYEVKATASTRNNNSYNALRVMDDLHSPV